MSVRRALRSCLVAALLALIAGCAQSPPLGQTAAPPAAAAPSAIGPDPGSFADNPIVYFLITDRFVNGNPANDNSYGRQKDGEKEIGTFHGGDLAGVTQKLKEGYFRALGVNALWITAPYEQIRGWVVGGNKEFKHYAYHGYYALDFTVLDKNMGNPDELRELIDVAHAQGIRILFDVVMNHPGYADLWTLAEFKIGVLWPGWEKATLNDYHSYIDYNSPKWPDWWGPDWVRSGLRGYDEGGRDDLTMQLAFLPDFRTEAKKIVGIPELLKNKLDTRVKPIENATVRKYLVTWLSDWVHEYGVDGFRCDTVKHVEPEAWAELKAESVKALRQWKADNPTKKIDDVDFWMTGEIFPHGVERDVYFDSGFDNLINFDFQKRADNPAALDKLYQEYADKISRDPSFNVLSYVSSHDTYLFDRKKLIEGGTALLLAPGGVQIFYGDETARPYGPDAVSDKQQATRSDMNWDAIDRSVLAHWQKLTQFRKRHVALAKGAHARLADVPYTFSRTHPKDRVVVALGVKGLAKVPVDTVFAEGQKLRDGYSGRSAVVQQGAVEIEADPSGIVLLEALR